MLYDADLIVNLEEKQGEAPSAPEHLARLVANSFLTEAGAQVASQVLLGK